MDSSLENPMSLQNSQALDAITRLENYLGGFDALVLGAEREEMFIKPCELHEVLNRALEDLERIEALLKGATPASCDHDGLKSSHIQ